MRQTKKTYPGEKLLSSEDFQPGKERKMGNNRRSGHRINQEGHRQWYATLHGHEVFCLTQVGACYELTINLHGYNTKTTRSVINEAISLTGLWQTILGSTAGEPRLHIGGWSIPVPERGEFVLTYDPRKTAIDSPPEDAVLDPKGFLTAKIQGYAVKQREGYYQAFTPEWVCESRVAGLGAAPSYAGCRGIAYCSEMVLDEIKRFRSMEKRRVALMAAVLRGDATLREWGE